MPDMQNSKICIANWKMNLGLKESVQLAKLFKENISDSNLVICPSSVCLESVNEQIKDSCIKLGAQNVFWDKNGAYTGEISVEMLEELNCEYVILGHSERRELLCETDDMIGKKLEFVLNNSGVMPIVCIGEKQDARDSLKHFDIVESQIIKVLENISDIDKNVIFAYEPVWAIGTGNTISVGQAAEMHEFIYKILSKNIKSDYFKILYGGSVNSSNALELGRVNYLDGFLIGGASLKLDSLKKIINDLV